MLKFAFALKFTFAFAFALKSKFAFGNCCVITPGFWIEPNGEIDYSTVVLPPEVFALACFFLLAKPRGSGGARRSGIAPFFSLALVKVSSAVSFEVCFDSSFLDVLKVGGGASSPSSSSSWPSNMYRFLMGSYFTFPSPPNCISVAWSTSSCTGFSLLNGMNFWNTLNTPLFLA